MKYKDPVTGEWKEIYSKTADTLPVGTVVEFEGEEVPAGWEEVIEEKSLVGRYVGAQASIKNTSQTLASNTKVTLDSISTSHGSNYFKLENNGIVINSDKIKTVEVSGSIFLEGPSGNGYVWGQIRKNNTMIRGALTAYASQGGFLSVPITPIPIDVVKGDAFTLIGDSTVQGKVRKDFPNTWLYIKVLEWKEV